MDQKLTLCPLTFIYLLINIIIIIIQAFEPNTILRLTGSASNWIEPCIRVFTGQPTVRSMMNYFNRKGRQFGSKPVFLL